MLFGSAVPTSVAVPACDSPFQDLTADHPGCGAVVRLHAGGVIFGFPDGTFRPGQPVTRAEGVMLLDDLPPDVALAPQMARSTGWRLTQTIAGGLWRTATATDPVGAGR